MKLRLVIVFLLAIAATGCHLIDDDLSVCGADYLIDYQVQLVTEVNMTIDEKLSSDVEKPIAESLKKWSQPYFSGRAHDLDMSFYALDGTDELLEHQSDIIDATSKSYTLYIPRKDYRHLAVVNIAENTDVSLMGGQYASSMHISQRTADTLSSHSTAVYTARQLMYMTEDTNLVFNVHLYMVSSAVALVVTNEATAAPKMKDVYISGTASDFRVNDSVYTYNSKSVIHADKVCESCYAMVTFPSPDAPAASAVSPRVKTADNALWKLRVYTTMPDGKITESIISFPYPLHAGVMEIIKIQLEDDGSVTVVGSPEVGVSVHLDWKPGDEYEVITG